MAPSSRRSLHPFTLGLGLLLAAALTLVLQQPTGSPPRAEVPAEPRNETQAEEASRAIRNMAPVEEVQVVVRNGTALISVQPQPGFSSEEHRAMEREIADHVEKNIPGIERVLVTTDRAVMERIRRLRASHDDVEKRAGPRMAEQNIRWAREFDDVLRHMEQMPNHAEARRS